MKDTFLKKITASKQCDSPMKEAFIRDFLKETSERVVMRGGGLGSSTIREVGGWGRVPFSRNLMSPTPRRKWYLTTGRRAH